ncbi:uncharacterized protein JN550_006646 [Neoarthrinium moseri]|uniref:uncharacterized protein n=1 Tax=Neoarthrinium moseri TaxID=1658444 RepID=UPI001FDE41EB|nr:uncharacterized protein JN550_006646 [Neoarthrinium moseri]KAI1868158.1 hypothetical protein JN550_006646 [Neoarthrinium moseri]
MASASVHAGPYQSIPDSATPGLLFLKAFLPSYDALGKPPTPLRDFFSNETRFTTNSKDASPVGQVLQGFVKRVERLAKLYHEVAVAYDIGNGDGSRTVIFEGINGRVLKNDPEQRETRVKEVTVIELKPVDGKLVAVDVRTTMENHSLTQLQRQLGVGA